MEPLDSSPYAYHDSAWNNIYATQFSKKKKRVDAIYGDVTVDISRGGHFSIINPIYRFLVQFNFGFCIYQVRVQYFNRLSPYTKTKHQTLSTLKCDLLII